MPQPTDTGYWIYRYWRVSQISRWNTNRIIHDTVLHGEIWGFDKAYAMLSQMTDDRLVEPISISSLDGDLTMGREQFLAAWYKNDTAELAYDRLTHVEVPTA